MLGENEIHYISSKFEGQPTTFLSYCTKRGAGDGEAPMLKSLLDVWELSFGAGGELYRGFTQGQLSESPLFCSIFFPEHTHTLVLT